MLDILLSLDRQLLFFINHWPHNFFTNNFFLFFSIAGYFGIIWFVMLILLFLYDGLDNKREIIALILSLIFNVILVEIILKNIFLRIRPETALESEVLQILVRSNSYSFPSGHATIAFAAAYILSLQRRHLAWFFYLFAFLVALSRVYLGRHYPSDIFIGSILGYLMGFISYRLVLREYPIKK